jgi:hypothetical protein
LRKPEPRNVAASVRARLLNLARERGEPFERLAARYALERLLCRLGQSVHQKQFILKGALLFPLWSSASSRPTQDLDLLGQGDSTIARLEQVFRELCCELVEEDGIRFQADTIRGIQIREDQVYEGVRISLVAELAEARLRLQVDIGFGDVVTPAPEEAEYPTILDYPAPRLLVYPRETVIAEKFQAMVVLGIANSRMKDFYDIRVLARSFSYQGELLCQAIRATFDRRRTLVPPSPPLALTRAFFEDRTKQEQWRGFLHRSRLEATESSFADVVGCLREFLIPPMVALARDEPFDLAWTGAPPWRRVDGGASEIT